MNIKIHYKKSTNGFWKNKKDYTLDVKPFNECIHSIYIGEKNEQYIFNKNVLDADLSNDYSN